MVSSFTQACTVIGEDKAIKESIAIEEAEGVLDSARLTMSIIATVTLVEVTQKHQQHATSVGQAKQLLKEKDLPDSLQKLLRKLIEANC